jgi:hypothetical protein
MRNNLGNALARLGAQKVQSHINQAHIEDPRRLFGRLQLIALPA